MSTIPNHRPYLSTISPPRDLICPISQELFRDPVVCAGDGCTYDRSGISTWIREQQQQGAVRSPVTNAFMDTTPMRMTTTTATATATTTTTQRSTTIATNHDDNEIAT